MPGAHPACANSYQYMSTVLARWWDSDVGYSFRHSPTAIIGHTSIVTYELKLINCPMLISP